MLGTILIFSKRTGTRLVPAVLVASLALAACGGDRPAASGLTVVATTSIAGDLVSQIVGDDATVEVLVPIGTDPHDFQPSSQQAASLRQADLVVAWGLGLEEGLEDVLRNAEADGVRVLELSALVDPIPFESGHSDDADREDEGDHEDGADHEDESDDHDEGGLDPHAWMDPVRMATAAREIGAALAEIEPEDDWSDRAERISAELMAVHEEVESILAAVPPERRKLVTNHDSLGYLADRYGFEIVGVAIPGGSTLASPSSGAIAELVDVIRDTGVTVLFAETTSTSALLDAVAGEVDGVRVVEILEGSLAPQGEPGDTLAGMLVLNAETIAGALGS